MVKNNLVFLSVGSNIGNRNEYINRALNFFLTSNDFEIIKISDIFETKPLEVLEQSNFLNLILKINTVLEPIPLLNLLQELEKKIGRIYRFDKGPREIDLDILTFNSDCITSSRLILPHPALFTRPFIKEILISISEESIYNNYSKVIDADHHPILSK